MTDQNDLQRLREDLADQPSLRQNFDTLEQTPRTLRRWALDHGYEVSEADVLLLLDDGLSDDDLEMVAGGWDGNSGGP